MSRRIGLDAKLYRGTAGGAATTEVTTARDLSAPDERAKADATTRGDSLETIVTGMRKFTLGWDMPVDDADTHYAAFRDAYNADTAIALRIRSNTTGKGYEMDFKITKFAEKYTMKDLSAVDVEAEPFYVSRGLQQIT